MSDLPRELGDFVLEKKIGQGGMGIVYLGYQKSLDRKVAIKLLKTEYASDSSFLTRFKREAKSAAKLIHPNIIQVYHLGDEKGEYYFAMEYVEGKDLQEILNEKRDKFSPQDTVSIIIEVAKALAIAGQFGIVHRDIKPSNVLITKENNIKVMDFGIAKAFHDSSTNVTISGAVMGTANYMSPEQVEGKVVDQRTDIYSLGVMFYQLLTGSLPYVGENSTSLAFQHVHSKLIEPIDRLSSVNKALNDICVKCLMKKKEDRYQSASELMEALQFTNRDNNAYENFSLPTTLTVKNVSKISAETTISSSKNIKDNTLAPNMTASTKMDTLEATQTNLHSISNKTKLTTEKINVKPQNLLNDTITIKILENKNKTFLFLSLILACIVILGIGLWWHSKISPDQLQPIPITVNSGNSIPIYNDKINITYPPNELFIKFLESNDGKIVRIASMLDLSLNSEESQEIEAIFNKFAKFEETFSTELPLDGLSQHFWLQLSLLNNRKLPFSSGGTGVARYPLNGIFRIERVFRSGPRVVFHLTEVQEFETFNTTSKSNDETILIKEKNENTPVKDKAIENTQKTLTSEETTVFARAEEWRDSWESLAFNTAELIMHNEYIGKGENKSQWLKRQKKLAEITKARSIKWTNVQIIINGNKADLTAEQSYHDEYNDDQIYDYSHSTSLKFIKWSDDIWYLIGSK